VVRLLVERDDVEVDSKDDYGRTPLSWAAERGHKAVVQLLVERVDVEVNSKDNNEVSLDMDGSDSRRRLIACKACAKVKTKCDRAVSRN
jgi:ankyrin repeat protein